MARVRTVAHIQALIERVGEDAHPWEAVMKNILLNAELWTIAMRSGLFLFHVFPWVLPLVHFNTNLRPAISPLFLVCIC